MSTPDPMATQSPQGSPYGSPHGQAPGVPSQGFQAAFPQGTGLSEMAELARAAINAANNAAEAARAATQASSSTSEKKRDRYHLILRPATFSPSDRAQEVSLWRDWFWGLRQYLLFIDGKYEEDLEYVERSDVQEVDWDLLDEEEQHRGRFLYAGPVVELGEEHRQEQRSRGPETAGDELPT